MKILIVKTSSLGDIIHCFGVVDYLKSRFPEAEIDWVVEKPFAPLLQAHSKVSRVLTIASKDWRRSWLRPSTWRAVKNLGKKLQKTRYDALFDLQGNIKSALITRAAKAQVKVGFGKKTVAEWPNLLVTDCHIDYPPGRNIREDYLFVVRSYYKDNGDAAEPEPLWLQISEEERVRVQRTLYAGAPKRPIVVCPGSAWPNKQLTDKVLAAFLKKLQNHYPYYYLFVWGTPEEHLRADRLIDTHGLEGTVVSKMPLPALQNLMAYSDLVIAMDSLPLHLAATTTTPTFSVFGASSMNKYKPVGIRHGGLQGACPYRASFDKRCSKLRSCSTGDCIKNFDEETLFKHFIGWKEHARI